MSKNKYASDFRSYMNVNIKNEESPATPNTLDSRIVSLDIWDKKYRLSSAERHRDVLRHPVNATAANRTATLFEFATQLGLPVQLLIDQFRNAGIPSLTPEVLISERHKAALLEYLRKEHGATNPKITLTRKNVSKKRILVNEEELVAPLSQDVLHQNETPSSECILLLEDVNEEFIYLIANNPSIVYQLGSRKFEELIAKLFSDRGHEVSLTKSTRDGGYDVWAKVKDAFSEFVILVECKKYSPENKVGVEIVRGLYGVTEMNKANQGLIITSSFFTKDAHQEQLRIGNRIGLKDYNNLVEWLKPYSK